MIRPAGVPSDRRAAWLAWSLAVLCLALMGVLILLARLNRTPLSTFVNEESSTIVFTAVFPFIGALIASRHPRNAVGWLMIAAALFAIVGSVSNAYARHALVLSPGSLPAGGLASWIRAWAWIPLVASGPLLFLVIPDGRPSSRVWRRVLYVAVGEFALSLGGFMATWPIRGAALLEGADKIQNVPLLTTIAFYSSPIFMAVVVASVASVVVRFVRSRGDERQQLKWIAFGALIMGLEFLVTVIHEVPTIFDAIAVVPLAIAIGVAILKYRLYDIDVVINKTLVYGAMAAFITAVYVAVVVGIGRAVGSDRNLGLSILATAMVAVGFAPVRERVQRVANRVVYGTRATPYEVLSEFSGGMANTVATEELLPRMARIVAESVGAAEVDVWLQVGSELVREASWPQAVGEPSPTAPPTAPAGADARVRIDGTDATVPVRHQGELLGVIAIGKPRGETVTPAESKLLEDLASQAGLVLRNVRLIEELKTSRQRLVSAQDEERRRLERNLHDGAQQRLVSIALALRMARGLVTSDLDPRLNQRIDAASEQLTLALSELRELARGIHPAILTERGLAAGLTSLAERSPVSVAVDSTIDRRLPAAVEAAAYFVVSEALANAAKYAHATSVTVRAGLAEGGVFVDVIDDGIGGADPSRGSGLRGLVDRVAAVDGTLEIDSRPGQGTRLACRIPVPGAPAVAFAAAESIRSVPEPVR